MKTLTKDYIFGTFYEMMRTHSFDSIRVQDICKACDISRATFYHYFSDKYELALYLITIAGELTHPPGSDRTHYEQFIDLMEELGRHRQYFRKLLITDRLDYMRAYSSRGFIELYFDLLTGGKVYPALDAKAAKYYSMYHGSGVAAIYCEWLVPEEPEISAEELAEIIYYSLSPAIRHTLYGEYGPGHNNSRGD